MKEYTVRVYDNGEVNWFNEKEQLHRKDGPAIEEPDGYKAWWSNGKRHRENGPAVEKPDGSKEWWINGQLHREDGPAVEYPDGYKAWWSNGKQVTEQEVMGHTIIIDGKEVKISAESYRNLKENL
jgi:hypothetical protein